MIKTEIVDNKTEIVDKENYFSRLLYTNERDKNKGINIFGQSELSNKLFLVFVIAKFFVCLNRLYC